MTREQQWKSFLVFIQSYLSMEEWFHDNNEKQEVRDAMPRISFVLASLQKLFPRPDNANGYNIPKMHGMTKFPYYIQLFGSAMNFYGGPGESHHEVFVKAPGIKTQRRVGEFASQTANQYYNMMVTNLALRAMPTTIAPKRAEEGDRCNIALQFTGQYQIMVTSHERSLR